MKKNALLIALTCFMLAYFNQANAQERPGHTVFGTVASGEMVQQIIQRQNAQPAQRGTAITDRLIGWSTYSSRILLDSAHYKYNTLSRGSALDNTLLSSYTTFTFNPGATQYSYASNLNRNSPSVQYDSGYRLTLSTDSSFKAESSSERTYTSNRLATEIYLNNTYNSGTVQRFTNKIDLNYNALGMIVTINNSYDTSAALIGYYKPASSLYVDYNNGRISRDSFTNHLSGIAKPAEKTEYAYDAAGNMTVLTRYIFDANTWKLNVQEFFTYTANNKLSTHLAQYNVGMGYMRNVSTDSFRYQGSAISYSSYYEWDANNSKWENGYLTYSYYTNSGNLDSQITNSVIAGVTTPKSRTLYSYNAFDHFDKIISYYYDGVRYSTTPDGQYNFYYETFTPTAINTPALATNGISLYPNPANDVLNIRFKDAPKGAVNVRIYNAIGQLMEQVSMGTSGSGLPISQLAPGNYIAEVTDGAASQRLTFVKQ